MSEKILITSALLYANGPLHFGHLAGAYLPADAYARFQRLRGKEVLFVSGSDEYGVAITLSAELAGRTPKEHVDHYHALNKRLFQKLQMSFDHYARTSWPGHAPLVQAYFRDLLANGFIEEKMAEQLYSEREGRFLADRYVVGRCPSCGKEDARGDECPSCGASYEATDLIEPKSKISGTPLVLKQARHWFLRLDLFKERLIEWIKSRDWKPNVVHFVKRYIEELRPRAITRDLSWGVPLPIEGAKGKVLYVWFDAPIGYISASVEWAEQQGDPDKWRQFWLDEKVKLVHFIGKDNVPFHAVIFPAMTMGQSQPYKLVDELPANEFLMLEGRQFSKSEGWFIDLEPFLERYSSDQLRYTLAVNAPETSDSEFTWRDFQSRCNSELLGKYGNLVNRVLVFAAQHCGGCIPERGELTDLDRQFLEQIEKLAEQIASSYEAFRLRRAAQEIMELAQLGNGYFDRKSPWKASKESAKTTVACCLECLKLLALVSSPIIPGAAQRVWEFLGNSGQLSEGSWQEIVKKPLPAGQQLRKPTILFRKIEEGEMEEERKKLEQPETATKMTLKEEIGIEAMDKLDLRVGEILAAEPVPKSRKLLKLQVDLGFEKRQVVAGIAKSYKPEELIGKRVVVVANLKPAKLMGTESFGMVLAASSEGGELKVVTAEGMPPGSSVS